ncbi:MAG: AMP-binding protein [Bacteroidota bacterium]
MQAVTLIESFYQRESQHPDRPFLKQPFGERWETYSWAEAGQMARKMAQYLLDQQLPPKSKIGLVSKNCREWIIADLAIMMAGHISVPFFATLNGEQINEVLRLGDVAILFVGKIEVWDDMKTGIPDDIPVIRFPHYAGNSEVDRGKAWEEIIAETQPLEGNPAPQLEDLWTIIFTSGTTGTPKGVMINYQTLVNQYQGIYKSNPLRLDYNGDNQFFSFLPLNHIAERGVVEMMCILHGGCIAFTESINRFAANLRDIRPTLFFAVPRIWTKLRSGILAKMPEEKLNRLLRIPLVSSLVKRKIKKGLGLDRSRQNITGAAAIPQATKQFFAKIGLPLAEAYGMTENCATSHMLFPGQDKPGSVGRCQEGTECRIDPETNEILTRAAYTMDGYYEDPGKTAETITDGWLHTGDQGYIDEDGFLFITGRVKDTFKTAKAKFIAPKAIEEKFTANADIEQLCLLGLGMPQPVLIVSLSEAAASLPPAEVQKRLEDQLNGINAELASYKKVGALVVAKEAFSIENGLLTPTLKIKRSKMHQRYQDRLLAWIEQPEGVIWE